MGTSRQDLPDKHDRKGPRRPCDDNAARRSNRRLRLIKMHGIDVVVKLPLSPREAEVLRAAEKTMGEGRRIESIKRSDANFKRPHRLTIGEEKALRATEMAEKIQKALLSMDAGVRKKVRSTEKLGARIEIFGPITFQEAEVLRVIIEGDEVAKAEDKQNGGKELMAEEGERFPQ